MSKIQMTPILARLIPFFPGQNPQKEGSKYLVLSGVRVVEPCHLSQKKIEYFCWKKNYTGPRKRTGFLDIEKKTTSKCKNICL